MNNTLQYSHMLRDNLKSCTNTVVDAFATFE